MTDTPDDADADADDHTHKVVNRAIRRGTTLHEPGDELTPTEGELSAFGDNLVEITPETAGDRDRIESELTAADHPAPEEFTDMTVREYRSYMAGHDMSTSYMEAVLAAEQATDDPRSSITGDLKERLGYVDSEA